jgi:hypothetical protein
LLAQRKKISYFLFIKRLVNQDKNGELRHVAEIKELRRMDASVIVNPRETLVAILFKVKNVDTYILVIYNKYVFQTYSK